MIQFNIYAGKKNDCKYLYTTLCEDIIQATELAKQEMELEYELYRDTKTFEDALSNAYHVLYEKGIALEEKTLKDKAFEIYTSWKFEWGQFGAVYTDKDSISQEDLILDYVIDNKR